MDRVKECFLEIERLQRLLVEGEARVVRQEALIAGMKQQGLDTTEAERLLASFRSTLEVMHHSLLVRFERSRGISLRPGHVEPSDAMAPHGGNPVHRS